MTALDKLGLEAADAAPGGAYEGRHQFTFSEVDAVIANVNKIAPHKRVAFTGRLKFLLKNGLPTNARPGRGRTAYYSFAGMIELGLAVDLMQCGIDQRRAASLIAHNRQMIARVIEGLVVDDESTQARTSWIVPMSELRDLTDKPSDEYTDYGAIMTVMPDLLERLLFENDEPFRAIFLDANGICKRLFREVQQLGLATEKQLKALILADLWIEQRHLADRRRAFAGERETVIDPANDPTRYKRYDEITVPTDQETVAAWRERFRLVWDNMSLAAMRLLHTLAHDRARGDAIWSFREHDDAQVIELAAFGIFEERPQAGASSDAIDLDITSFGVFALSQFGYPNGGFHVDQEA